jgi:hypothetical protein
MFANGERVSLQLITVGPQGETVAWLARCQKCASNIEPSKPAVSRDTLAGFRTGMALEGKGGSLVG